MDPTPGTIGWIDLTAEDATGLRDFYAEVCGWAVTAVGMEDGGERWEDFAMGPADAPAVAGVCHRRGTNASQPPGWLMYVSVADVDARLDAVRAGGGEVVQTRDMGAYGTMAVCQDPAGHWFALIG